jgi:hypothetical protein
LSLLFHFHGLRSQSMGVAYFGRYPFILLEHKVLRHRIIDNLQGWGPGVESMHKYKGRFLG